MGCSSCVSHTVCGSSIFQTVRNPGRGAWTRACQFFPRCVSSPRACKRFASKTQFADRSTGRPAAWSTFRGRANWLSIYISKFQACYLKILNSIQDFKISRLKNIFQEFQVFQDFKMFLHLESKLKANLHACKRFASKTQFADR